MENTNKQFASSLFYLEHNISIFTSVPLKRDTSDPIVNNIYPKSSFFVYAAHYYLSIFAIRLAISMSPKVELILIFDYLFIPIFFGILLVQAYRLCPVLLRKILAGGR